MTSQRDALLDYATLVILFGLSIATHLNQSLRRCTCRQVQEISRHNWVECAPVQPTVGIIRTLDCSWRLKCDCRLWL
jgi:hypothetical protein